MASHPIKDFLTDDMIQFLKELNAQTLKHPVTIFYGTGPNGKSAFVNVLKKIKKCRTVHGTVSLRDIDNMIKKEQPDIIIMNDPDLNTLEDLTIHRKIVPIMRPIIIITNVLPKNLLDDNQESTMDDVKIINFRNVYHDHFSYQYLESNPDNCMRPIDKKALRIDEVDNDEAMKIITQIMEEPFDH